MKDNINKLPIVTAIAELNSTFIEYMAKLKRVLDFGDDAVEPLVASLSNKYANPIAKCLGLLMYSEHCRTRAIPALLDWIIVQSPIYPEVLEALVRAGDHALPAIKDRLKLHAESSDDEAVTNLLDLGSRLEGNSLVQMVEVCQILLRHPDCHIREATADAVGRIGLPYGNILIDELKAMAAIDADENVRNSAQGALLRLE